MSEGGGTVWRELELWKRQNFCQGCVREWEEWRRNTLASSSFAFYHLSLPIGQISLEAKGKPEFVCDTEQYRLTWGMDMKAFIMLLVYDIHQYPCAPM